MQIWTKNSTGKRVIRFADTQDISAKPYTEFVIIYNIGNKIPDIVPKEFFLKNYKPEDL